MRIENNDIQAVLFDLDGTLVDSAQDMVVAMRRLRAELGEPVIDLSGVGTVVSKGGRAMMRRGFPGADETRIETLLPRFLDLYAEAIATHATTFPGVDTVLAALRARDIVWGIVTNKPGRLARALLSALSLDQHCAALVSGDCLAQKKPDPEPILHACRMLGVNPQHTIYVGDDARDIEAGQCAGTMTVAAAWGYLDGEDVQTWGADCVAATPAALLGVLGLE
jgi:phosphoglycolate phosphatase